MIDWSMRARPVVMSPRSAPPGMSCSLTKTRIIAGTRRCSTRSRCNGKALQSQLQSTRVGEALLENAVTIALEADEHLTRAAAINALGHSSAPGRDSALMELFDSLTDRRERSQALVFLLPNGVESRESRWLIDKLSARDVPQSLKQQIPTKLVLSGLHGSRGKEDFVEPLLDAVPHQWRDEIVAVLDDFSAR